MLPSVAQSGSPALSQGSLTIWLHTGVRLGSVVRPVKPPVVAGGDVGMVEAITVRQRLDYCVVVVVAVLVVAFGVVIVVVVVDEDGDVYDDDDDHDDKDNDEGDDDGDDPEIEDEREEEKVCWLVA